MQLMTGLCTKTNSMNSSSLIFINDGYVSTPSTFPTMLSLRSIEALPLWSYLTYNRPILCCLAEREWRIKKNWLSTTIYGFLTCKLWSGLLANCHWAWVSGSRLSSSNRGCTWLEESMRLVRTCQMWFKSSTSMLIQSKQKFVNPAGRCMVWKNTRSLIVDFQSSTNMKKSRRLSFLGGWFTSSPDLSKIRCQQSDCWWITALILASLFWISNLSSFRTGKGIYLMERFQSNLQVLKKMKN